MGQQNQLRVTAPEEALEFETSREVQVVTSFNDIGLKEELLCGIYNYGFDKPSAIQQRAVVRVVIAQAQSSTGKTSMIVGNGELFPAMWRLGWIVLQSGLLEVSGFWLK